MTKRARQTKRTPRSVLVGVEHGIQGEPAILVGLELERLFGARLELVHAVPPLPSIYASVDTTGMSAMARAAQEAVQKELLAQIQQVLARRGEERDAADLVRFVHGPPARVLVEEALERKADVIVVGAHHKDSALDFTRTVRGVLAHAPRGVWVQTGTPRPIRRITVPVDLSEPSLDALATACEMARAYEARVEAIHCFHELPIDGVYPGYVPLASNETLESLRRSSAAAFEEAMQAFAWGEVEHATRFVDGDPVTSLLARQADTDLFVLSTHGRSGLAGIVLGNVAYSLLKGVRQPVLALRRSASGRRA